MRLAITTPTGKVGSKLVDELLEHGGHELRLLTRNRDKVQQFVQHGAEAFEGRLEDRDFFTRATSGVDALFLVLPIDSHSESLTRESDEIVANAVAAIKANNIQRVVFVSSMNAHLTEGTGPILYLRQAEQKLREAVPNLTVLRPVFYMDQFLSWTQNIADDSAFYMPFSEKTTVPMIATRDVAAYAADVLTDTRWSGKRVVPLHGPREYSFREAADILGKTLGMNVRHVEVQPKEAAERLRGRGWSEEAVKRHLELQNALLQGSLAEELPKAQWKMQPTTFESFAKSEFRPAFDRIAAVHA